MTQNPNVPDPLDDDLITECDLKPLEVRENAGPPPDGTGDPGTFDGN